MGTGSVSRVRTLGFRRIAVVNRGEPAIRLIRAVQELNAELGLNLRTIAFVTTADAQSLISREADETYSLGPPQVLDSDGTRKLAYLDYGRLEQALFEVRADAAWVGWGFVAEHAEFAELCARRKITFLGPRPEVMRLLGDKISSKRLAEEAKVPVLPWAGPLASLAEARRQAERIGFPLMVKASAGGGGRGIRAVNAAAELEPALTQARAEAIKAFGDGSLFLERRLGRVRHVEVQVIADRHGTTWAVGVRDCSVQRRHQKVIEEAPSPALSEKLSSELCEAAVRLCQRVGYTNVGTVEFLFDPATQQFYFLEVNTRLQVEHPITEATTGVDLVKLQLLVGGGGRLEGSAPKTVGHAIEARLNAEDADRDFAPAPGRIEFLRLPAGPGVRVDSGVTQGDHIPPDFDSMIGKIVTWGRTRQEALGRMRRALRETAVVISGGTSNRAYLLKLIDRPEMQSGEVYTSWLDAGLEQAEAHEHGAEALILAAVETRDQEFLVARSRFVASIVRGRPTVRDQIGHEIELRHDGNLYKVVVHYVGGDRYRVTLDARWVDVRVQRQNAHECVLTIGTTRHRALSVRQGSNTRIEIDGCLHQLSRGEQGAVRAPSPALVLAVHVRVGDEVAVGTPLVVLEAMKMESRVASPLAGTVRQVSATAGVQVEAGATLVVIEPHTEETSPLGTRLSLPEHASSPFARRPSKRASDYREVFRAHCRSLLAEIRSLLLGYDVAPTTVRWVLREYIALRGDMSPDDEEMVGLEIDLLRLFVDQAAVWNFRVGGRASATPEQLFLNYIRAEKAKVEEFPAGFAEPLERLRVRYLADREHLEPDEMLYWIARANQRVSQVLPFFLGLLELHWETSELLTNQPGYRALLDLLIEITQDRFVAVSELARRLRFRCFDWPLIERARKQREEALAEELIRLVQEARSASTGPAIDTLIHSPQPILPLLHAWYEAEGRTTRQVILELCLRRFYRSKSLQNLRTVEDAGVLHAIAEFADDQGHLVRTIASYVASSQLERGLELAIGLATRLGPCKRLQVDLLVHGTQAETIAGFAARAQTELSRLPPPAVPVRACLSYLHGAQPLHVTFNSSSEGFIEDRVLRDVHHLRASQHELWRLKNFSLEQLVATPTCLVLRGVAQDNSQDKRLFVYLDVRDLSSLRDEKGAVVELPMLESTHTEAMALLRDLQYRMARHHLPWNRVYLCCSPLLDLKPDELARLASRLAVPTKYLGIQKLVIRARLPSPAGVGIDSAVHITVQDGMVLRLRIDRPSQYPIRIQSAYSKSLVALRRRGQMHPYELIRMLTPQTDGSSSVFPIGRFTEYDLEVDGTLAPVQRPYGENTANLVVGVISNVTPRYPEGISRVVILGDPSREMGALAEPECRRVIAALDLAQRMQLPVDWFPVSSGAKISMSSGTENLDWTAEVLRRLVLFTQGGGEVNIVVTGINVGAQSYWNAEATMLMHCRGILVMTPAGSMVLTGKRALDISGGVSAADNQGIGGLGIMLPNGQAQYEARDITQACFILLQHYELTYVAPGERFPRRQTTDDPFERDVSLEPHHSEEAPNFTTVGQIFARATNAERKKPFSIRAVMDAVVDKDLCRLERWARMYGAEMAVVYDAFIGGIPVCLIGTEGLGLARRGFVPGDGPETWCGGTLYPQSSKKVARAINSASGNRPAVVLANLAGFDGSPESMRRLQLEYGAEIGRAMVNFRGPLVFCTVSRYHGGAFVVFSRALNDNLQVAALEGSFASVIGGAPAAEVVLAADVRARVQQDPRVRALRERLEAADEGERLSIYAALNRLLEEATLEKKAEVAAEFDRIHSIERAKKVGSLHHILAPDRLRPFLIRALERGIAQCGGGDISTPPRRG